MSKRTELQKEFYKEIGNYKGDGRYNDRYVKWLEDKILAQKQGENLPIQSVSVSSHLEELISKIESIEKFFTENQSNTDCRAGALSAIWLINTYNSILKEKY